MHWQDIVISIAQLCFIPAMIPSIRNKDKPALSTSFMNVVLVLTIAFCMFTLGLWFAAVTSLAIAATWAILALQKLRD